jgi:hypothetical protein
MEAHCSGTQAAFIVLEHRVQSRLRPSERLSGLEISVGKGRLKAPILKPRIIICSTDIYFVNIGTFEKFIN